MSFIPRRTLVVALFTLSPPLALPLLGQAPGTPPGSQPAGTTSDFLEVTATRVPEDVEVVPASITVLTGEELAARGADDLASALSLVSGVSVAPGGDGGPASSIPEIWGLREFDAFLLVVDGVPWGGAFNPALASLDLSGVDRIEILRGAAPVMYGATSFVGVIQVIHRGAGQGTGLGHLEAGSYGSGGGEVTLPLPGRGRYRQTLIADARRQGFKDDRSELRRGHFLYRGNLETDRGAFRLDLDGTFLRQDPASPHPRVGQTLSPLVPLDANHNPRDARLDEDRLHLVGGYDRSLSRGTWSTTLSLTDSSRDVARGFLLEDFADASPDARGFSQEIDTTDVYFDSHLALRLSPKLHVVAGIDHLYGDGSQDGETFSYEVGLDGSDAPVLEELTPDAGVFSSDRRNFSGLYVQAEWNPTDRLRVEAGARLNRTDERKSGREEPVGEEDGGGEDEENEAHRTTTRGSGILGLSFRAWSADTAAVWLFADFRNTFKPAAVDFGPEAEADILDPETAKSYEAGAKGRFAAGRASWQLAAFQMDFENLVVSQIRNGLPTLRNAGSERFRGVELEASAEVARNLRLRVAGSLHDARFRDFLRLFDGEPFQLRGNRLEMSARELASAGLFYAPDHGLFAYAAADYVGRRFLNQRNTAEADPYTDWSAGAGWRAAGWELRLDGRNLSDTRPPVSESELGDAQYYRLPARSFRLSWVRRF